jgi:hypothetical protein
MSTNTDEVLKIEVEIGKQTARESIKRLQIEHDILTGKRPMPESKPFRIPMRFESCRPGK